MEDYKISYNFLYTQVLCVDSKHEELGLNTDADEMWLGLIIDLDDIYAIKEAHDPDKLSHGKSNVYLKQNDVFTINIDYEKAVEIWTNFKVLNAYPELRKK